MGFVYEIEHEAIGRRFALKVLRLDLATDEDRKRFHREARALGRVSSPRVAQVVDFGLEAGVGPYYVMELLDGETLKDRLDREGRLRTDAVVALAIELCEALAAVHEAGIVHRDLKPSNVGLTHDGPVAVKLLDFGLATSVEGGLLTRVTASQELVGTLPYMAPEQFYDTPPAPASDLYALGVILYEMLTGRLPFSGSTPGSMIQEHLNAAPPPFEKAVPGLKVPAWLEAIVLKLLAKDPSLRYPTAAAVARALRQSEKMSLESTVVSSPIVAFKPAEPAQRAAFPITGPTRTPNRLGLMITATMLVGAAATLALFFWLRSSPDPASASPSPPPPAPAAAPPAPAPPEPILVAPVSITPDAAPASERPRKKSRPSAKKSNSDQPWTGDIIDDPR
jgi:serine/threonine-protein kinase